jgi:hypothetical protein
VARLRLNRVGDLLTVLTLHSNVVSLFTDLEALSAVWILLHALVHTKAGRKSLTIIILHTAVVWITSGLPDE